MANWKRAKQLSKFRQSAGNEYSGREFNRSINYNFKHACNSLSATIDYFFEHEISSALSEKKHRNPRVPNKHQKGADHQAIWLDGTCA